jgi:5'-nucleotidase
MQSIRRIPYLLLITLYACGTTSLVSDDGDSETLTFLHLNDTYRVDAVEEGRRGGFSRVATLVRQLQAEGKDVRILHGGDFLYPSLESQIWNGEQIVEAMNFLDDLAPMYVVPGNHEFDPRSPEELIRRIRESRFDWIGDNIRLNTGEADVDQRLQSGFSFTFGEKKIGIFGLTAHPDHGGNTRDYTPIGIGYVEHAERAIQQFEAGGADLILGLTHLRLANDMEVAKLKARHPTFRFVVGGHDHEPEFAAGDAENAIVMKGASNARMIWQIDVRFVDGVAEVSTTDIAVDESIALDVEYQFIADKWRTRLLDLIPFLPARVGDAAVPLDGRETAVRNGDSNWGMFIADQMRSAFGNPPAWRYFASRRFHRRRHHV